MSCYWRIECTDCKAEMLGRVNHGERWLLDLLRHREALESIARTLGAVLKDADVALWFDGSSEYCGCIFRWEVWAQHAGHRVRVVSEYGEELP